MELSRIDSVAEELERLGAPVPEVALVLGSGLGDLVTEFSERGEVPYERVPHMAASTVSGHAGRFAWGVLEGRRVIAMRGRLHPYEGHDLAAVVRGVRAMLRLGARVLIVTNASGGLVADLTPGSLVLIRDHVNLSGRNCLVGPNLDDLGPRFPDMTTPYTPELLELAERCAGRLGIDVRRGVYAGVLGPTYETPAEVRMLGMLGCHVVGMSTVQEVIAARHMGARVLGISCVTNLAAGLAGEPLKHADVEARAKAAAGRLTLLVRAVVAGLAETVAG